MAPFNLSEFLQRLTRRMATELLGDHSDQQLVARALATGDEAALQAMVQRHGPMVYRVCWRVLQHTQDTEDAFQVTFLVLARKLRSLRKHASLASWLHGVAHRVALKAQAQAAARRRRECQAAVPEALPPADFPWGEVRAALDGELNQLPGRWRLPLILCHLEGRTQDEAASQLGWSKSMLRRRLQEARDALARRLRQRGLTWSAVLSAVLLSDCVSQAAPGPGLVASTVAAVAGLARGKTAALAASAPVAHLLEGVLKTMFLSKLKLVTAVLFVLSLVTAGMGGLSYATLVTAQADTGQEAQPKTNETPTEEIPDAHVLLEKARELEAAQARQQQAEVRFQEAQKKRQQAQEAYAEAQDRYEAARARGRFPAGATVRGTLVKAGGEENGVRVEYWKEVKGDGRPVTAMSFRAYETFPVAPDAAIRQDNVPTKLSELKPGSHITLALDGKRAVRIRVDGGTVPGPIRYVSADQARKTIAVLVGSKGDRRIYHLLNETEVRTAQRKAARIQDLKAGRLLLLTRSVMDTNTVIRVEVLPPGQAKQD
jgi:RNA polymerase sigma factor (sigma-70 family)